MAEINTEINKETLYETLINRHSLEIQNKFNNGKVAITGLGGLGSNIAIFLARAGVGNLHLIDFDKVDVSNIHRQQYFLEDIGKNKTNALKSILLRINPYLHIKTTTIKIDETNIVSLLKDDDIICEAFDNPEAKALLVDSFFENFSKEKYLVCGSGMAGYYSSNIIKTKKISDRFYICGDGENSVENSGTLFAPRVGICAAHQANMIIRILIGDDEV